MCPSPRGKSWASSTTVIPFMSISKTRRHLLCVSTVIAALSWFGSDLATAADGLPHSVNELWAGFDPRKDPLETEVLKEWEQAGVVCRIVRYQVVFSKERRRGSRRFTPFQRRSETARACRDAWRRAVRLRSTAW